MGKDHVLALERLWFKSTFSETEIVFLVVLSVSSFECGLRQLWCRALWSCFCTGTLMPSCAVTHPGGRGGWRITYVILWLFLPFLKTLRAQAPQHGTWHCATCSNCISSNTCLLFTVLYIYLMLLYIVKHQQTEQEKENTHQWTWTFWTPAAVQIHVFPSTVYRKQQRVIRLPGLNGER